MSDVTEVAITRHVGKPTSGRFVYRSGDGWYWQCDLHPEEDPLTDQYGELVATQEEAFRGAEIHAKGCRYASARRRKSPDTEQGA